MFLWRFTFFDFIAINAMINRIAVKPLMPAYIGGKNEKSTFGILTLKRIATAIGITTDKQIITFLYNDVLFWLIDIVFFF